MGLCLSWSREWWSLQGDIAGEGAQDAGEEAGPNHQSPGCHSRPISLGALPGKQGPDGKGLVLP